MSVGKSKIGELSVDSDFGAVLEVLTDMSNELNKICVNQTRNGFDKKEIEDKLAEIDNYISKNPVVEKGRIEGSEDVKKIIDLVNQEVSGRLKNIELNIRKEDRVGFETIEKSFKNNTTNTKQKRLEDFEKKDIEVKTMSERAEDANEVIKNRTERIEKAKAYDKLVKELCDKDKSLDEPKVEAMLLAEVPKISAMLTTVEKREATVSKIKEPNDYKEIISKLNKQVQKAKYDSSDLTKEDYNEIAKSLKDLQVLKEGNPVIEKLLSNFEANITKEKSGEEKITAINGEKLMPILSEDKYQEIDWKEAIAETKEVNNENNKKDIEALLDYNVFKLYPGKVKTWKDGLKAGVRVSEIAKEMSEIGKDEMKLHKQVKSLSEDLRNMDKLDSDLKGAKLRKNTYNDISSRQKTTTAKLFGQDMELTNHRGEIVDFAKLEAESREDVVEGLYDKVREDGDADEIDRKYNDALPVEYRKPNIFSRAWYRITHRETWGFGKKTLTDARKEAWVKSEIGKQIDEIKEDASGDKSWTLTPEQEKAFNERQKTVVENAKKKAREKIVTSHTNAKNANDYAKKEYKKLQREDDEDFTL